MDLGSEIEGERASGAVLKHQRQIALGAVRAERQELIRLRDEGRIGDAVQRRLERELDLTEARQVGGPLS